MNLTRPPLVQFGAAGCLAASGVIHAELYRNGYRVIPWIGPAFLLQASGSVVVALLLLITCAAVARLAAAALAAGALVGFILSRTIGVLGFVEYGLQPAPQALISVLVEIVTLALLAVPLLPQIAAHPNRSTGDIHGPQHPPAHRPSPRRPRDNQRSSSSRPQRGRIDHPAV